MMLAKQIWLTSAISLQPAMFRTWFTQALHLIIQVKHAYKLLLHTKELAKSVLWLTWSNILESNCKKREKLYTDTKQSPEAHKW